MRRSNGPILTPRLLNFLISFGFAWAFAYVALPEFFNIITNWLESFTIATCYAIIYRGAAR